jgi:hypothetical protein
VTIRGFVWTDHALLRLAERGLTTFEVEAPIRDGHSDRLANPGRADWLISARTASGIEIEAIYDHPHRGDASTVRIVSVWRVVN